jgi:WD40 repeat protein
MSRLLCVGLLLGIVSVGQAQEKEPPTEMIQGRTELFLDTGAHVGKIIDLFFTPDGKRLISVGVDKTVQVWAVAGRQRLKVFYPPAGIASLDCAALSSDGKTLALGGQGFRANPKVPDRPFRNPCAWLLNLENGRIVQLLVPPLPVRRDSVKSVAFSPDGNQAVVAGSHTVCVWRGLKDVWNLPAPEKGIPFDKKLNLPKGTPGDVLSAAAFSPDGARLATGSPAGIQVWDLAAREGAGPLLDLPWKGLAGTLAWSPDGSRLAAGGASSEEIVAVWSAEGKLLHSFTVADLGKKNPPASAAFSWSADCFTPTTSNWSWRRSGQEVR